MRKYYVLTFDSSCDYLQGVSDHDMGDCDSTVFWEGIPFQGPIPSNVKLWVTDGKLADYLPNPLSWTIVSDRLLALIRSLVNDSDMQVFPAPTYDETTRKPVPGYNIINIIRCIDGLAAPLRTVDRMVLRDASIPRGVHLFKLVGEESLVIASQEMFDELWANKVEGMAFIKTTSV